MSVSEKRKKHLWEKLIHAAKSFGKAGTRSDHPKVPKEEQLSIDLGNKKPFSIIGKILNWIENKLKFLFPRYNLFTEVGTEERKVIGTNIKVKYFPQVEQFEHALYIGEENKDFKLYSLKGRLYDTRGKISKTRKDCVAYVVTLDDKLVVHEHIDVGKSEYAYRHSTLAGGKPVICSGLIKVVDGKIAYIDNNSGHYKPKRANLYNAVKKLEDLFLQDAKVTYLGSLELLRKQIPLICRIPHTQESIKKFLKRMKKKGKDGLTKYQKHFTQIKEYNDRYIELYQCTPQFRRQLFLKNYKPVPILDRDNHKMIKMAVEHSIRKIIGAAYGHKPIIDFVRDQGNITAVSITFCSKNNYERLTEILDLKGLSYLIQNRKEGEYMVSVEKDNMDKFIKNTLQINVDSVKLLRESTDNYKLK
ncbi:hypothetical protein [Candidatus Mesenet endosymbiont of Agriotes lineatus]|uniref:hypothetical protein n=1 Tax=Candidatus Mesenet endosymbiont of Agriotes lineatus TaxID=3077948 RepID=UPI0030D23281